MKTEKIRRLIQACEILDATVEGVLKTEGLEDRAAIDEARAELEALEAENAAMREALMVELGEWKRMVLVGDDEDALSERAMHVALIEHALRFDIGGCELS